MERSVTSVIDGLGAALPRRVVTNDDLAASGLDTSHAWIAERTGIHRRHWADPEISTGDLAAAAAECALAGLPGGARDIDLLLLATTTPDQRCPATAPDVAARIGATGIAAVDLSAACSGFLYALAAGDTWIRAGSAHRVLVIGAETLTRIVDPLDRDTAVLFGDGAGAVLLRRGQGHEAGALGPVVLGSDGTRRDLIEIAVGGARRPWTAQHDGLSPAAEAANRADRHVRMRGREVFGQAVRRMTAASAQALERAGWPPASVGAFVGHQANLRILDVVAERLAIPPSRRFGNIRNVGNTSSASIPLALTEAVAASSVPPGTRTLLTAFGAGLAWGSATLTWPAVRTAPAITRL